MERAGLQGLVRQGVSLCLRLATVLVGVHLAFASETVSWIESYNEAIDEARQTGKPIFLEFRCAP